LAEAGVFCFGDCGHFPVHSFAFCTVCDCGLFLEGSDRPLKTMGTALSDLTADWECECRCCRYRDKDDGLVPTADEMDSVVADRKPGNEELVGCFGREQHQWDPSAAAAAIVEIGVVSGKMGVSARSMKPPPVRKAPLAGNRIVNTVRFPIPPEYLASIDSIEGKSSPATPPVNTEDGNSLYAPGALHEGEGTKVLTPKVQKFRCISVETCDHHSREATEVDAALFQDCQ